MDWRSEKLHLALEWLIVGLPIAVTIVVSLLPLRLVFRQALIGIVLIWFQVSLMLGVFHE